MVIKRIMLSGNTCCHVWDVIFVTSFLERTNASFCHSLFGNFQSLCSKREPRVKAKTYLQWAIILNMGVGYLQFSKHEVEI